MLRTKGVTITANRIHSALTKNATQDKKVRPKSSTGGGFRISMRDSAQITKQMRISNNFKRNANGELNQSMDTKTL